MQTITFTAYCACAVCCGPNAAGITASGDKPIAGVTVATSLPFGTRISVTIPGQWTNKVFIVNDRLAKRYANRVDIYMLRHVEAKQFGIRKGSYTVIRHDNRTSR